MNTDTAMPALLLGEAGGDPIEDRLRETVRATIEAPFGEELAAYLGRIRYGRGGGARKGYRHGRRERELVGAFGAETVSVPRARIEGEDGRTTEWRSKALPRYQRLTKRAEALIAAVYLAGTNTRRVKRALFGLFQGAVGKDVVSRVVVDRGYRGHGVAGPQVLISGTRRGLTPALAKLLRRRSAIEPEIGHMKTDGRLARCALKGTLGDALFAVLCGCGHNIRKILAHLRAVLRAIVAMIMAIVMPPQDRQLADAAA